MKKLPNKISTEELLKALEGSETEESTAIQESLVYHNDVPLFMSKYNLGRGENPVSKLSLYRLYCRFTKNKVRRQEFGVTLDLFITANGKYWLLDKDQDYVTKLLNQKSKVGWVKYSPAHPSTKKHFEQFMEGVGLKAGNKWVEAFVLVKIYHKWCRENRKSIRFKPRSLVAITSLYLETRRTTNIANWFKVDETILNYLSPDEIRKIRDDRRQENREAYQKKKVKKGQ